MNFTKRLLFEIRVAIDHNYYPSMRELADWLDWHYSTTHRRLARLEHDGAVEVHNRGGNGTQLVILPAAQNEPGERPAEMLEGSSMPCNAAGQTTGDAQHG